MWRSPHYTMIVKVLLCWAKNPMFHAKKNHIDVKYHFIRDVLEDKHMELVKVHTYDNPADILTKGVAFERFAHCRALMGMC